MKRVLNYKFCNRQLILNLSQLSCEISSKVVRVTDTEHCGQNALSESSKKKDLKAELNGFAKSWWHEAITESGSGRP